MKKLFKMKNLRGFTLIELMVTLGVVAILVAIAAPSFQLVIEKIRVQTAKDRILSLVMAARSDAVSRGSPITICPSMNQSTCSGSWSNGLIYFVDNNSDRTMDVGDELLKVLTDVVPVDYGVGLISVVSTVFQFDSQGRALERGTFVVCGPFSGSLTARGVIINLSGGIRRARDSGSDGIRETHEGSNISC